MRPSQLNRVRLFCPRVRRRTSTTSSSSPTRHLARRAAAQHPLPPTIVHCTPRPNSPTERPAVSASPCPQATADLIAPSDAVSAAQTEKQELQQQARGRTRGHTRTRERMYPRTSAEKQPICPSPPLSRIRRCAPLRRKTSASCPRPPRTPSGYPRTPSAPCPRPRPTWPSPSPASRASRPLL